ncbi:MAG: hypothetical protein E7278_02120 [Lachnospiraceae bacterium]|nr:hypothetical protein [Lachnospiraceae bacterium]
MKQYFELTEVISSHSHQWGLATFFVLYLIVIFMMLYKGQSVRSVKNIAISMCVILTVRYFPPIVNFFALHFFKGHEFARAGWGLLIVPVIAYGLVWCACEFFERKKTIIVVLPFMCLLIGINTQFYFKLPDNYYKLPQEAIDVERIVENTDCKNDVGLTFSPDSGTQSFKQIELVYYGLMAYGGYSYQVISSSQEVVDGKYEVLITHKEYYKDYVIEGGYEKVGETENTIVYKKES